MIDHMIPAATIAAASLTLFAAPGLAHAKTLSGVEVTGVGVQGSQIYILTHQPLPGCSGAIVYQATDTTGQYVMSVAITARSTGNPLARLDHSVNGQGSCWVQLIQL